MFATLKNENAYYLEKMLQEEIVENLSQLVKTA